MQKMCFIKIYVKKNIFDSQDFTKEEVNLITKKYDNQKNLQFRNFNLDKLTILSWLEHLKKENSEIFIVYTNQINFRLINIINYFKCKLSAKFNLILSTNNEVTFRDSINYKNRSLNSYISFNSGMYNISEPFLIKHILIDDLSNLYKVNKSIILNMGVNSIIYYNKATSNIYSKPPFFSIVKKYNRKTEYRDYLYFKDINTRDMLKEIDEFHKTGKIKFKRYLPKNIGRILMNNHLNSIFIFNNKIYLDEELRYCLSDSLNIDFYSLLNETTNRYLGDLCFSARELNIYFISLTISRKLKENLTIISPFNQFHISPVKSEIERIRFYNLIAFKSSSGYYIYNYVTAKIFKSNLKTIKIFEYLLKNRYDFEFESEDYRKTELLLENISN
ncbi:hypothetical protein DOS70_01570 [Staphylococcus felis]|uniref:hypothetical protein n=1 Tax=Staphylococcus felis TaxID=46127 RepID=UPI000E23778C|nr:hypothetical protein [Staphylococcus felis]REH97591.1 hypothetical protein DOS70_01570 [Staphylococcus felis]REI29284.1 hypothetical protein DOS81_07155 [Staphylococcus felis]